jgi:hypothetical protein
MITAPALVHGDVRRHLDFDPAEHPVALQLGGSDPAAQRSEALQFVVLELMPQPNARGCGKGLNRRTVRGPRVNRQRPATYNPPR